MGGQLNTRVVSVVPGWVRRPAAVVAATEDYLLRVYGWTSSPEALGSRTALAWVGGLDAAPPFCTHPAAPSWRTAAAVFDVAAGVMRDEPYPTAQWWAENGESLDRELSAAWWVSNAAYGHSRSYAGGVAVALGWAMGVIGDPAHMIPVHRDDGTKLLPAQRVRYAVALRRISGLHPADGRPLIDAAEST
jgi:hypothetical protein